MPSLKSTSSSFSLCTSRPVSSCNPATTFFVTGVYHIASRWVSESAIDAERDPARLFAQLDAGGLLGRDRSDIEYVDPAVGGIADPDLPLVGTQADAMAGAAMALRRPLLEALYHDAVQDLAGPQVSDFEAEKVVDGDVATACWLS